MTAIAARALKTRGTGARARSVLRFYYSLTTGAGQMAISALTIFQTGGLLGWHCQLFAEALVDNRDSSEPVSKWREASTKRRLGLTPAVRPIPTTRTKHPRLSLAPLPRAGFGAGYSTGRAFLGCARWRALDDLRPGKSTPAMGSTRSFTHAPHRRQEPLRNPTAICAHCRSSRAMNQRNRRNSRRWHTAIRGNNGISEPVPASAPSWCRFRSLQEHMRSGI